METGIYLLVSIGAVVFNILMIYILNMKFGLNNKGEVNPEPKDGNSPSSGEVKFTPEQQKFVDKLIDSKYKEFKTKFGDYDHLKQKVSEYESKEAELKQKDLEESKKYDEAKKTYEGKFSEYQKVIQDKERLIQDMQINHALSNEVNKQGGYIEETIALLKQNAILKDGVMRIKSKDSSGFDVELPVEEGIKKFLESRPYLVRASFKPGSGAQPPTPNNNGGNQTDLNSLNQDLKSAMDRGDTKKTSEIKNRIKEVLLTKGVRV